MGLLIRLLLVVGVLLMAYKFAGTVLFGKSSQESAGRNTDQIKKEIKESLNIYQQKLDDALEQSDAAQ